MNDSIERDITQLAVLDHREAMRLAGTEYGRFADLLDELSAADWSAPTPCPDWTVRDMAGHVLGAMRSSASLREQRSQLASARRHDGPTADGLTATQVERTCGLTSDDLRREMRALIPAAVRGRSRTPALLRRLVRIPVELPVSGSTERWRLGYLLDRVLTRDVWMHRSDIAMATGREFAVTADHDGRIVADVVSDWAGRHHSDFCLRLDGVAGGVYRRGLDPIDLQADAVQFCRTLSGRGHDVPLGTEVPF